MTTSRDIVVAIYGAFGRGDVPAVLGFQQYTDTLQWAHAAGQ